MLIRSQNRDILINIEQIDCICIRDICIRDSLKKKYEIRCFRGESITVIGYYSTQEKAMKVLDMIEHEYTDIICDFRHGYKPVQLPKVFQMPADEEVEKC